MRFADNLMNISGSDDGNLIKMSWLHATQPYEEDMMELEITGDRPGEKSSILAIFHRQSTRVSHAKARRNRDPVSFLIRLLPLLL
jgi:hypothetical protein